MTAAMLICVGMTWGMCHAIVRQEYPTMAACMAEREYQRQHTPNVAWIKCELVKPPND